MESVPLRLPGRPSPVAVNAATLSFLTGSLCLLNSFLPENEKTEGKSRERKLGREGVIVPGLGVTADLQRNLGQKCCGQITCPERAWVSSRVERGHCLRDFRCAGRGIEWACHLASPYSARKCLDLSPSVFSPPSSLGSPLSLCWAEMVKKKTRLRPLPHS